MSDNNHSRRSMNSQGYYIALILCAAAIGITGYLYARNAKEEPPQLRDTEASVTLPPQRDVEAIATVPRPSLPPATEAMATEPPAPEPLKTQSPVAGETVGTYSMECLSYNETTRDWRTHNGIDIAAEAGTEVVASADGTVYTAYEDDALGTTVVIRHLGGYTTRYASLSRELSVKAGDKVTRGQAIGTVGTTAVVETAVGPHVHFSVTHRDAPMDPAEFLKPEGPAPAEK